MGPRTPIRCTACRGTEDEGSIGPMVRLPRLTWLEAWVRTGLKRVKDARIPPDRGKMAPETPLWA